MNHKPLRKCAARFYRGARQGQPCTHPATRWQPTWRMFLCGVHARGFLHTLPVKPHAA